MDNQYIKELKERINSEVTRDANQADNALAQLTQTTGWAILKESIENRIHALLQPGVDKTNDLVFIGAVTMARELAIEVLQSIIDEVETTKEAKLAEKQTPKQIQKQTEKSEQEAL